MSKHYAEAEPCSRLAPDVPLAVERWRNTVSSLEMTVKCRHVGLPNIASYRLYGIIRVLD